MKVFYCPTSKYSGIVDLVNAEQRGVYTNKTKEELEAEYRGPVHVMLDSEAIAAIEKAKTTSPVVIDEDRFYDLLECLPPSKWQKFGGAEAFHICERITYTIVTWCVRIGKEYFSFDATCTMTSRDAVDLVKAHIEKSAQPA